MRHARDGLRGRASDHVDRLILIGSGGPTLEFHEWFGDNVTARLRTEDLEAAHYWMAGIERGVDRQNLFLPEVSQSGVTLSGTIEGPHVALASAPTAGVFASIEDGYVGTIGVAPIGLRTRSAGPDLVSGVDYIDYYGTTVLLVPLE